MYRAFILDKENGDLTASVQSWDRLQEGDIALDVKYSSLNYKDALAVTGKGKIIRGEYPFIPGIDLVGKVSESNTEHFGSEEWVIGTGWGFGESHWGGYTEQLQTQTKWLVALPATLSPKQSMIIGTAGLTAMLSVMALEDHDITSDKGEVLVTGASGGAGSLAVALLSQLGYTVVASTGSETSHGYLRSLGASRIVQRSQFEGGPERPLQSGIWAGVVDAVGGKTLATALSQTQRHGAVAAFGNAGGTDVKTTVFPFILRGVQLLGIDSNTCPNERRITAWHRLGELLTSEILETIHNRTIGLEEIEDASANVLDAGIQGRILVDVRS